MKNLNVLLWSFSQGAFHRELLSETILSGLKAYTKNNVQQDYIVLAVAETPEELDAVRQSLVEKCGQYEPQKRL